MATNTVQKPKFSQTPKNLVGVFSSDVERMHFPSLSQLHTSRSGAQDQRSTCVAKHTSTSSTYHRNTGHTGGSGAAHSHTLVSHVCSNRTQSNLAFSTATLLSVNLTTSQACQLTWLTIRQSSLVTN